MHIWIEIGKWYQLGWTHSSMRLRSLLLTCWVIITHHVGLSLSSPTFFPQPTSQPTALPSAQPSSEPSGKPSSQPTSKPVILWWILLDELMHHLSASPITVNVQFEDDLVIRVGLNLNLIIDRLVITRTDRMPSAFIMICTPLTKYRVVITHNVMNCNPPSYHPPYR